MLETDVMSESNEIDLVKYGVLWQKVQDMDKKVDKMERNVEELLALANKGKGGLWFGMSIVSGVSAVVGYALNYFKH
ncbi:hypothetical protein UFOVP608_27 [uncultured Caudovirales phage]|jgi:hypothetical protein|uniref:Uncharacterized protein n=1 Tax=uncultured Caudovirales phage TaxID=2100421 RepID=A0A6J5N0M1_9CAUD|nr:hypothetical protein UFOVP608_27 [uncultured Caudovirales phage]